MHRAGVLVGAGRRRPAEEPGATASSSPFAASRADGPPDDRYPVDDGADQATTTTMIYVKEECDMDDDEDSKHQILCLPQSRENENVSPSAICHRFGGLFFFFWFAPHSSPDPGRSNLPQSAGRKVALFYFTTNVLRNTRVLTL